ncbi:MAG: lysophospholipid acyltransferase family protein [Candidatus Omnitrophica bacterium]|nr:lysophospholipid acyltransferase family protein [Candidatus Omnitrophota bacterium]
MFKFYVYKLGQFIVRRLSIKAAYRFAIFFSDIHFFLSFRDRQAVKDNLQILFPSETNQKISVLTREVFRSFGKYLVEFFRMANELDAEFIEKKVRVKNIENLEKALARGKGAIILTAHIGNWELGGVILSTLGFPVVAIALPHKERPVNDLFNKQRQARGMDVVSTHHAIRRCMEILKNNGAVAIVADRDFSASGEVLEFLGKDVLMPKGAAIFSARAGAAIVPTFLVREKDDTFSLILEEPLLPPEEISREEKIEQAALVKIIKDYIPVIENKIRQYPSQWLMFRRFWEKNV